MLRPADLFIPLLAVALAGCAGQRQSTRASNWEEEPVVALPAPPQLAPPPTAPPPIAPLPPPAPAPDPAPVLTPVNVFTETWVPLDRWCKTSGLPAPSLLAMAPTPTFSVNLPGGMLVLQTGGRAARWQGMDLRLGFAPRFIDGHPYVHALDLNKTVLPLLGITPLSCSRTNALVVIDAGHGGEDSGTKSAAGSHYEKEFTLDWARRLERILVSNGWQVLLTRRFDHDLVVSNRVAFAEEHGAALFLSLHFNSAGSNGAESGLETYCLTPTGMPSTVTRGFTDDSALNFPNNAYDSQNLQLALRVHRALLDVNGHHDRGVRRARFLGVLRGQQRPAILVEGGYLSNAREARLIGDPTYREKLAAAVAKALE